jgi:tRNA pseudouridine55 synthase
LNGLLLVRKPIGISSFDVIRKLRRVTGVRKIGHAGTLDPLASGLMIMLFGSACKKAAEFSKLDKRYLAVVRLGANSSTGDGEGEITPVSDRVPVREEVEAAMQQLEGEIEQVPPAYSAIKVGGREAYKRVRAGEVVEIPARKVTIYENVLLEYEYPLLKLDAHVSSGTYIRTLAEDLGKILDTGAYLSGLVRSQIGKFSIEAAIDLETADQSRVQDSMIEV